MQLTYTQLISRGALLALGGYVVSGPVGFLIVQLAGPQPAWASPAVFAENYRTVQDLPYYFGLLLIGGMLMIAAGHYLLAKDEKSTTRFNTLLSLSCTSIFATLICFNYLCQTTFVRQLALNYQPEYNTLIAGFSMANPMSLCWTIEMWGYGILGVATWLLSGYYRERSPVIRWLLILNGAVSVLAVIFTMIDMHWLLTTAGIVSFLAWNVLMIVLMLLMYRHFKTAALTNPLIR